MTFLRLPLFIEEFLQKKEKIFDIILVHYAGYLSKELSIFTIKFSDKIKFVWLRCLIVFEKSLIFFFIGRRISIQFVGKKV